VTDPKEKIHRELADYVAMEEHLSNQDRLNLLKTIFERHLVEKNAGHLISEHDILTIADMNKTAYGNLSLPLCVGSRQMGYDDIRTIANIESFLSYLNQNFLARKEIKINYKRSK
jgi:hypothetical protein